MVIFYEEKKPVVRTKTQRIVRRTIKTFIIAGILFWISLCFLSTLNSTTPEMKKGLEDYLQQATGMDATIGTLKRMSVYPDVVLEAENISLHDKADGHVTAHVGTIKVALSFWDVMKHSGVLEFFSVQDVSLAKGVLSKDAMTIKSMELQPDPASLVVRGVYDGAPVEATLEMNVRHTTDGRTFYRRPDIAKISFTNADFEGTGTLKPQNKALKINFSVIKKMKPLWGGRLNRAMALPAGQQKVQCVTFALKPQKAKVAINALYVGQGALSFMGQGVVDMRMQQIDLRTGPVTGAVLTAHVSGTTGVPDIAPLAAADRGAFTAPSCETLP